LIRRPPRSTRVRSSAASDVYKRQRESSPPFLQVRRGGNHLRRASARAVRSRARRPPRHARERAERSSAVPRSPTGTNAGTRAHKRRREPRGATRRCCYESVQRGEGVLVEPQQTSVRRRPASERSEGALLGAPTKRVCGSKRTPSPTTYRDASRSVRTG